MKQERSRMHRPGHNPTVVEVTVSNVPVLTRKQKVSHRDYITFRRNYDEKLCGDFRFGQAFLNQLAAEVSYPDLYYCNDRYEAERLIYKHFIKFD